MAKKDKGQATSKRQRRATLEALERGHIKSSMHLELQKFGDKDRDKKAMLQPQLLNLDSEARDIRIATTGLDLTLPEMKALHAIQKLLHETGYRGNLEPQDGRLISVFKFDKPLPRMAFTWAEYFQAYGLKRQGDNYNGREREDALQALRALDGKKRAILYKREGWIGEGKGRRWSKDYIQWKGPLISIEAEIIGYRDLSSTDERSLLAGVDVPGHSGKFVVSLSALFVDQLDSFFAQIPINLHDEIREATGGGKHSSTIDLFAYWLLTRNKPEWTLPAMALAQELRLGPLIEERQWSRIRKILQDCLDVAMGLEFLLGYEWTPSGKLGTLLLRLNPARCRRILLPAPGEKEQEEKDN